MHDIAHRLRWWDGAVLAGALLVLAVLAPVQVEMVHAPKAGTLSVGLYRDLGPQSRAAYDNAFLGQGYFAAFAVGENDRYGWTSEHSSGRAARANALARCGGPARGCRIVAEILPKVDNEPGRLTIRYRDQVNFSTYLDRQGPKAFAISENGAYGASWGKTTIWHAKLSAYLNCLSRVRQGQPDHLPKWPCRIVHAAWF